MKKYIIIEDADYDSNASLFVSEDWEPEEILEILMSDKHGPKQWIAGVFVEPLEIDPSRWHTFQPEDHGAPWLPLVYSKNPKIVAVARKLSIEDFQGWEDADKQQAPICRDWAGDALRAIDEAIEKDTLAHFYSKSWAKRTRQAIVEIFYRAAEASR